MADDEKVIRIEGQLDEGKAPEPTAGDKLRDQESATDAVRDSEFEDLLKKLTGVEKPPSGEGPATGDESLLPGVEPTPTGGSGSGPPIPPIDPTEVVGGGEAAGEAAGVGLEAAGVGLAAALGPIGLAAVGLVTSFTILTATMTAFEHVLTSVYQGLSEEFKSFSGVMQAADAIKETELLNTRLSVEPQVAPEYARVTEASTGFSQELIEIKAMLGEIIAPILEDVLVICKALFLPIKLALEAFMLFYRLFTQFNNAVLGFAEQALYYLSLGTYKPTEHDLDEIDKFAARLEDMLQGKNKNNNPPFTPPGSPAGPGGARNMGPRGNAGTSLPRQTVTF